MMNEDRMIRRYDGRMYCTASRGELMARLCAYEDTGLNPEEIKSLQDAHFNALFRDLQRMVNERDT